MDGSTAEHPYVELETLEDGIALIWLYGDPTKKVTTLSEKMLEELEGLLTRLEKMPTTRAAIFLGRRSSGFMAGADLEELLAAWEGKTRDEIRGLAVEASGRLQDIYNRVEKLPYPTIAAIHGACLGGGFELALACKARIAADEKSTKIGLPEVMLGLIPGAGGTQRLPRLIGMSNALPLILSGRQLDARRAMKQNLVDRVVPGPSLKSQAILFAQEVADKKAKLSRKPKAPLPVKLLEAVGWGRDFIEGKAKSETEKKTKGQYPAPIKAAELVAFAADGNSLSEGLKQEREAFGELASGEVARSLIQIFFMKTHGDSFSPVPGVDPRPVKKVGVVGAGFMGSGVAQLAAHKGYRVYLKDRDEESLARGMKTCGKLFTTLEKRRRLGAGGARVAMSRIWPSLAYQDLAEADLVVEAVFEDVDLKHRVLADVEAAVRDDCVIATNTSGLPLSKLEGCLKRPENFVGMHFFSPVHKMPLLEVIRGPKTSDEALVTVTKVGQKMGKTVIVVQDGQGFFTTRVLGLYLTEAFRQLQLGAEVDAIDDALEDFGWPVGPFKLMDEVGIDVGVKVSKGLREAFPGRVPEVGPLENLLSKGRRGRKAGKGFYHYSKDGSGEVDRGVYADLTGRKATRPVSPQKIVDQVMAVLVNESVLCLQEGIIDSPRTGDTGLVFGLGFPPFKGGLFRWVDEVGASRFVGTLEEMASELGEGRAPAQLLVDHAKNSKPFYGKDS